MRWFLPLTALIVTLAGQARGGELSVAFADIPTGTAVNLTEAGVLDWVHWGLVTETSLDRKAGVPPQISDFTLLDGSNGFAFAYQFADNFNGYTWSDGTPHMTVTNTTTGVWAYSTPPLGTGFKITAPAGTNARTLRVYVGAYAARGRFTATLSDDSAPGFTNTTAVSNQGNGPSTAFTINYSADSTSQVLTVTFTVGIAFRPDGNVTLQAAALTEPGANNLPFITITNPAEGTSVTAPADVTFTAAAMDADGTVSLVEFFADAVKIGEAATEPYTVTWTNTPIGRHVVTAKAIDNMAGVGTSMPITVFVSGTGGSLAGARTNAPLSANLTAEGTTDWAHWGLLSPSNFNHKVSGGGQISDVTPIGTNALRQYYDNRTAFSWSDGTPVPSVTSSNVGVFVFGARNGFEISAPADTNERTLRIYVGLYGSQGNFQSWLSDFSALAFTDTTLSNAFGNSYAVYTLTYRAATNGQRLNVRYVSQDLFDADFGNVTLQAATLQGPLAPGPVEIMNSVWSGDAFVFSFESQAGQTYSAEFTPTLVPATWITITNLTGTGSTVWITNVLGGDPMRFYRVTRQ
jgi:hypothetical protein